MRDIRDLVDRLRKNDAKAAISTSQQPPFSIQGEAADEIERLRALCSEAVDETAIRLDEARKCMEACDLYKHASDYGPPIMSRIDMHERQSAPEGKL